ncbi:hypothetical protein ANN_11494 [Periplaneta americana]|uniref:Uncharacterized protein n=1 Tax=Periplaneta americana TaxID=6978 RepID=A0ABQ8T6A8_PERAM|nr:hypothetical protein ANN_11494 [Periplaneta americana]
MAGLCEGGNEPSGSLKPFVSNQSKRDSTNFWTISRISRLTRYRLSYAAAGGIRGVWSLTVNLTFKQNLTDACECVLTKFGTRNSVFMLIKNTSFTFIIILSFIVFVLISVVKVVLMFNIVFIDDFIIIFALIFAVELS